MLTHIHIRHFAIVKSLSLDFQNGLHVLTGETGAGKSIWVDAVAIGLGARTDARVINTHASSCDITLCFDLKNQPAATTWLQSHDLSAQDDCIIRRIIDREKPSRTTINGIPTPQQLVREFSELILCTHSQHQHQRLLKMEHQRNLVDTYADHSDLLLDIQTDYDAWKTRDRQLQTIKAQSQNKTADLTLWQYQLDELEQLQLADNEYETLFLQYQQLHRAKQFMSTLNKALTLTNGESQPAASDLVQQALQCINSITHDDPRITNIQSLLKTAAIHLDEATDALSHYCHDIDFQSGQLDDIEKRLAQIQDIARKHHVDPETLPEIIHSLKQKIEQLTKSDEMIVTLEKEQQAIVKHYQQTAKKLSHSRQKAARLLSQKITAFMQDLGMNGGKLTIDLQTNTADIHPLGQDQIAFLIATNPGQDCQPLTQIVSGGELSRLSLIIQVLTAKQKNTPTLIFDEVDVGIGGKTAEIVGRLLRELSAQTQVLCVTHLPQVAAFGHHHYKAEKSSDGKTTSTSIKPLTANQRTDEIARMISGSKITEKSLSHANELLGTCT